MSKSEAIKAIRREYAERLRHQATDELRDRMRDAQSEGVPIAQIPREARLSGSWASSSRPMSASVHTGGWSELVTR